MKKLSSLHLFAVLIMALCFSACNRRIGYGSGMAGAPPSPPSPKVIIGAPPGHVTRIGPLDGQFKIIANSDDPENVNIKMLEVLEMCESGKTPVIVYQYIDEIREIILETNIREYMEILVEIELYEDDIDELTYDDDGKIIFIELMREEEALEEEYDDDEESPDDPDELLDDLLEEEEKAREREEEARRRYEEARIAAEEARLAQEEMLSSSKMSAKPSASRYAPIKEKFELIVGSFDEEKVLNGIQELLEMCASAEASVRVYHVDAEIVVVNTTIRGYIDLLINAKEYGDEIEDVRYNDEGKITAISLGRY